MPADPARRNRASWRAILDATFALLEEQGYDAITMGAIADRAGVGRQTIYRWWPSKGALVFEAFLDNVSTGPFTQDDPGDFPARLRSHAHGFRTLYVDTPAGRHLRDLLGAANTDPELGEALQQHWFEPRRAPVRDALRAAQAAGHIRPDVDPDTALDLLFGPLHYRLLVTGRSVDADFIDDVVDLVLAAVLPSDRPVTEPAPA